MPMSQMHPRFLIDTNCLINPYNDYYRPIYALSSSFWSRMKQLVNSDEVGILSLVQAEVAVGTGAEDSLDTWMQSIADKIIDPKRNSSIVAKYGEIIRYITNPANAFSQNAQQSWIRDGVADPWLVAAAQEFGSRIVTFEKYVTRVPNQPAAGVKIPNIARQYGVSCISLYNFMDEVGNF